MSGRELVRRIAIGANVLLLFVVGVLLSERGVQPGELALIVLMCGAPIVNLAALINAGTDK